MRLEPADFTALVRRVAEPLVVTSQGGFFRTYYAYLLSYRGLAFYTRSPEPIALPSGAEIVAARRIWVPLEGLH